MSQQLVKKKLTGGYENVMPKSWIEAIKDKNTGQTLVEILQGFNMYFLPYNGNTSATRCLVPMILRKKGLWITYVKYDGNVYTEWYATNEIDDKSWGDSSNWRIGNNTLVGDITISANGNWVINGTETEFKAVGEKGNTPLVRFGSNSKFQVSYNNGDKWLDISGSITNNLRIKKYIGINESLPTSGVEEGTIYMKGPYYAEGDTSNNNPIYRMWIYGWKGNTLAWQDNGEFTSIAAGVVQETGNSESNVMSQKATSEAIQAMTNKISELESETIQAGVEILVSSSDAGVYPYPFKAGNIYKITNLGNEVTISHRDTPTGQSSDSKQLYANTHIYYKPTSNGNYLRFGDPINATIELVSVASVMFDSIKNQAQSISNALNSTIDLSDNIKKDVGITTSGNNVNVDIFDVENKLFGCILQKTDVGQRYILSTQGGDTVRAYCVIDKDGVVIDVASEYELCSNKEILITIEGYLIVQTLNYEANPIALKCITPTKSSGNPSVYKIGFDKLYPIRNKFVNKDGMLEGNPTMAASDLIKYDNGDIFVKGVSGTIAALIAFYDKYGTFISSIYGNDKNNVDYIVREKDVPKGTRYFRCNGGYGSDDYVSANSIEYALLDGRKFFKTSVISKGGERFLNCSVDIKKGKEYSFVVKANDLYSNKSDCGGSYVNDTSTPLRSPILVNVKYSFVAEQDITNIIIYFSGTNMLSENPCDIELEVVQGKYVDERLDAIEEELKFKKGHFQFGALADYDTSRLSVSNGFVKRDSSAIYALYDNLVTSHPSYVEKINCDEYMSATGYDKPAEYSGYNFYAYKFIAPYTNFGVINQDKSVRDYNHIKVFVVSGTHDEPYAIETLYNFMEKLCNHWREDCNLEDVRYNVDFFILPVGNPWALSQENSGDGGNIRVNVNGVDLNRNMPTSDWKLEGEGTNNYSGSSAGSQYESAMLVRLLDDFAPNIFIDFHNFGADTTYGNMLYIGSRNKIIHSIADSTISRFSNMLKKQNEDFPSDDNKLLGWIDNEAFEHGLRSVYAHEHGILSSIYECAPGYCWRNGELSSSVTEYGTERVMSYNLQGFALYLLRMLQFVA